MGFINNVVDKYNYIFTDLADPRSKDYFLMASPIPIVTLTSLYLYFCKSLGPRLMKDRPPYALKNIVLVYDIFQVFMNSYLLFLGLRYMASNEYKFSCDPINYSDTPRGIEGSVSTWYFFISKVIDFLDTIFFVLRKKNNQISFLHVYHHTSMTIFMWLGVKYFPGGHGYLMGALNSFVHIVMYTYYFISGLGPEYQKYIWWKKHVTILQLVQFIIIVVHNTIPLFIDCAYPKMLNVALVINASVFIRLFGNFFYASYIKGSDSQNKRKTSKNGTSKNGTSKNGTDRNGTDRNGTATNGTAKNGIATNEHVNGHTHITHKETDTLTNGVNDTMNTKHKDV